MEDLIQALKRVPKAEELADPITHLLRNADTPPEHARNFTGCWDDHILLQAVLVLRGLNCLPLRHTEEAQQFLVDAIMSIVVVEETSSESEPDERQRRR
jgi:hypothetical protein